MNTADPFMSIRKGNPLIIAHRGLSWEYPENTMCSFEAALRAGADLIELDFRPTADGLLICGHDDTVSRYLNKKDFSELHGRRFSSFTWDELCRLDVGAWKGQQFSGTHVPILSQVLERIVEVSRTNRQQKLLIERKEGSAEQTLSVLEASKAMDHVIVQSFDWTYLAQLNALAPELPIAALGSGAITPGRIDAISSFGARAVHWNEHLRQSEVESFHQRDLAVWSYTLNSELAFRGALLLGIDGIATDRCDLAKQILRI